MLARAEATYFGAPEDRKQELKDRYAFRLEPETGNGSTNGAGLPGGADAR